MRRFSICPLVASPPSNLLRRGLISRSRCCLAWVGLSSGLVTETARSNRVMAVRSLGWGGVVVDEIGEKTDMGSDSW